MSWHRSGVRNARDVRLCSVCLSCVYRCKKNWCWGGSGMHLHSHGLAFARFGAACYIVANASLDTRSRSQANDLSKGWK